jgi:hypothetical protein
VDFAGAHVRDDTKRFRASLVLRLTTQDVNRMRNYRRRKLIVLTDLLLLYIGIISMIHLKTKKNLQSTPPYHQI